MSRKADAALALALISWLAWRIAVVTTVGDLLHPLEPAELKHTQIAWDLQTGRYGVDGFRLVDYVTNSGSIHHGSYSSAAAAYLAVSTLLGFDLLSVRATALLFSFAGTLALAAGLRRSFGSGPAALAVIGLTLAPAWVVGLQGTFLASHPESVLPLGLLVWTWSRWEAAPSPPRVAAAAAAAGYCLGFSYLLLPFVAAVLALVTPELRRRATPPDAAAAVAGAVAGLWPLWLIFALAGPATFFGTPITEDPSSTLGATALGGEGGLARAWEGIRYNLVPFEHDRWFERSAGAAWGGVDFPSLSLGLALFGPLLLLPGAWASRGAARRIALFMALMPAATYAFLAFANPFKPWIPPRYLSPALFVGLAAPGVALAFARQVPAARGLRRLGLALSSSLLLAPVWLAPKRLTELTEVVRPERAAALRDHHLVVYYNLGIGAVRAPEVGAINDLIAVRAAQASALGHDAPFDGMQCGLHADARELGLGFDLERPEPWQGWGTMQAGVREWQERNEHPLDGVPDDPGWAGANCGWGAAIRAGFDAVRLHAALTEGRRKGRLPDSLPLESIWEGFGWAWGRNRPGAPVGVPADVEDAVRLGVAAARALGPVPPAPPVPPFETVRGCAT